MKGELLSAAATLERILLVNPNLADVRLLYAVVLYRLDSLNEAEKELNALKGVTLPPELREQVTAYEKKIKQRSCKANKAFLDERTINPKTKKLLEALSTELGLSKEVIAELAITLYRFYKDKA